LVEEQVGCVYRDDRVSVVVVLTGRSCTIDAQDPDGFMLRDGLGA
jgi:hypothetical protein